MREKHEQTLSRNIRMARQDLKGYKIKIVSGVEETTVVTCVVRPRNKVDKRTCVEERQQSPLQYFSCLRFDWI